MTRYTKIAAAAAAALLAAPVFAAMTTDANLELDTDFQNLSRGASQGGRVEFNVAGKAGDAASGFVAGRGTLLIKRDGTAAADDMWGQIGIDIVDVKLGRFEATDMSPPGKDTFVEAGADVSGGVRLNRLRGRTGVAGSSPLHAALTINPGAGVGIEIGVVETKRATAAKGIRPVVSFAAGPVTVKVGAEIGKVNGTAATDASVGLNPAGNAVVVIPAAAAGEAQKFTAFGVTVGGAFEGVGFNVNVATEKLKANATAAETKSTSFGANATFGPAGVGLVSDTSKTSGVKNTDLVIYAAYSIPLFSTGATLTPAVSHQTGKEGDVKKDAATGVRVRLNYTF